MTRERRRPSVPLLNRPLGRRFPCPAALVPVICCVALLCSAAGSADAATASTRARLGVYRGPANPAGVVSFQHWLGAPVQYALEFLAHDDWAKIADPWVLHRWPRTYGLVVAVPLLPDNGGSLHEGAQGSYNRYYRSLARSLARSGHGQSILRLGWEFNGGWYRWTVWSEQDASDFVAYWRQIVTTMRAVAPQLKFDWNPNLGWQRVDPELEYPGDRYVDFVGLDVYDQDWMTGWEDPNVRWQHLLLEPWGLAWQRRFAREHRKQMSYPEWGVTRRDDGHGGGDNADFVRRMAEWIARNDVAYHVYFEFDAPDGGHALMSGQFPNSAAAFRTAFGGS